MIPEKEEAPAEKKPASPPPAAEARDQLAELASRAAYGGERTILQKRGKGIAAVVPIEDLELLEMLEEQPRHDPAEMAIPDFLTRSHQHTIGIRGGRMRAAGGTTRRPR